MVCCMEGCVKGDETSDDDEADTVFDDAVATGFDDVEDDFDEVEDEFDDVEVECRADCFSLFNRLVMRRLYRGEVVLKLKEC